MQYTYKQVIQIYYFLPDKIKLERVSDKKIITSAIYTAIF